MTVRPNARWPVGKGGRLSLENVWGGGFLVPKGARLVGGFFVRRIFAGGRKFAGFLFMDREKSAGAIGVSLHAPFLEKL